MNKIAARRVEEEGASTKASLQVLLFKRQQLVEVAQQAEAVVLPTVSRLTKVAIEPLHSDSIRTVMTAIPSCSLHAGSKQLSNEQ